MQSQKIFVILFIFFIAGCGALEPKYYPENETISSKLFPSEKEKQDLELEMKIRILLSGKRVQKEYPTNSAKQPVTKLIPNDVKDLNRALFRTKGKLLIINNLRGVDTDYFTYLRDEILKKKDVNLTNVEIITVSYLPDLATLRLMGGRQQAQYILVINSFSNAYRYHNGWTVPTFALAGIPYFYLNTQTIKVFSKVEYSLIDILDNVVLSSESATSEGEDTAILAESGIVKYKVTNKAIEEGLKSLGQKFLDRI